MKSPGKIIVNFEATPEQRAQIKENAAWFGLSQAEFLRQVATGEFLDMQHFGKRRREAAA
jgi:hypothetical protein